MQKIMSDTNQLLIARRFSASLAQECGAVLAQCRADKHGWFKMPTLISERSSKLGVSDFYVRTYESEASIYHFAHKAIFPDNTSVGVAELDQELRSASTSEISGLLEELISDDSLAHHLHFPRTEKEKALVRKQFDSLSLEEQQQRTTQIQYILIFIQAYMYNMLSVMVHGQKLTVLVPLAMQGDQEAFRKAAQIDRNLLFAHPYFKTTYTSLLQGDDPELLKKLNIRLGNPNTSGKIRFPALYMLFAMLDSFGCLDSFTASELLDVCDEAGLDRYQNRIEDEGYLNKRRNEYRRFQQISELSTQ